MQQILYHVPETQHPDTPALRVLQTLLSQGQSSRLYKRMVDGEQLALSVFGDVANALDPTVFAFFIQPRSGVDPAATEKALYDELARLQTQEVPAAELRKAKNQILANLYRQMKTIEGRANLLGTYEVFEGDYDEAVPGRQDDRGGDGRRHPARRAAVFHAQEPDGRDADSREAGGEAMKRWISRWRCARRSPRRSSCRRTRGKRCRTARSSISRRRPGFRW